MNIDQLTAKFAQAYVKRSEETYNGQNVAKLTPAETTAAVQRAQNAAAYYAGLNPSTAGTAGQPYQRQTGPTGRMSGVPELVARPIETRQNMGEGSFYNLLNPGFWQFDVPLVGDSSGFGTGGAVLTGLAAYGGTKGILNYGPLLSPWSYPPGVSRTPANMTPQATADFYLRSLGASPQADTPALGDNPPLTAMQGPSGPLAKSTTMSPLALADDMRKKGVPGPGVNPTANPASNAPVSIVATRPDGGKGTTLAQTQAVLQPHTPLVYRSGIPTATGLRRALAPTVLGGVPTGPRGAVSRTQAFRARAPMYAAMAAGLGVPFAVNTYRAFNPEDPNGGPLSGFSPTIGYNPAVLGAEPGLFGDTPMIYENVPGADIPYGQGD